MPSPPCCRQGHPQRQMVLLVTGEVKKWGEKWGERNSLTEPMDADPDVINIVERLDNHRIIGNTHPDLRHPARRFPVRRYKTEAPGEQRGPFILNHTRPLTRYSPISSLEVPVPYLSGTEILYSSKGVANTAMWKSSSAALG